MLALAMKIYCISLPSRRGYCEKFFHILNPHAEVEYIEPCIATNIANYPRVKFSSQYRILQHPKTTKYNFVEPTYRAKKTKLACSISHRNALNDLLDSEEDACIIMEDDNQFPTQAQIHNFLYWFHWLQDNTDAYNIVNLSPCMSKRGGVTPLHPNLYKASGYCMNCYCVTRQGALELLNQTLTAKHHTLDMFLPLVNNAYEIHPRVFVQNSELSTLANPPSPQEFW